MCEPQAAIKYWTERNQLRGIAVRAAPKAAACLVANICKNQNDRPQSCLPRKNKAASIARQLRPSKGE